MTKNSRWGHFPFGQPNTVRPMRRAEETQVLVIGTYPSAWHVTWSAPSFAKSVCLTGRIAAMAVDVEPTVFWNGDNSDFAVRLEQWINSVGFHKGDTMGFDGNIKKTSPSRNGTSGAKLIEHFLAPLKISETVVSYTDIVPVYMVKESGKLTAKGREQGDAIRQDYEPFAGLANREPASLPKRLPKWELPIAARKEFGSKLTGEISETRPDLVISLGEEVWEALMDWPSIRTKSPVSSFRQLCSEAYGSRGELEVDGRRIEWLPLIHPGQFGRGAEWDTWHTDWEKKPSGRQ